MIPTVTYTTRHRNIATVTTGGRSVTMTTLEVRTCPNCSRRTYAEGLVLSRRPVRLATHRVDGTSVCARHLAAAIKYAREKRQQ